jgi:hypothetical protein
MRLYEKQERLVTQIGSLPFEDVDRAVDYSLEHEIPFLPELTARGDAMMRYIESPGRLSCLEAFKRQRFETVKVQCVGPATLRSNGYTEDDAISRIYEHVEAILDGLVADEIILFLDEPALGYVGFDFVRLWEPVFESFPVVRGVHVCGNMQWDQLLQAPIDIVSFDASKYDITKYYTARGAARIAWGIERTEDIRAYEPGDLITLPCGMPNKAYSEQDAIDRLEILRGAADAVRARVSEA